MVERLTLKQRRQEIAKPKPWSHQTELASLVGKRIYIQFVSDHPSDGEEGMLLAADQFSLMVAHADGTCPIYFKAHIVRFWPVVD
jgi:hypothetical protein